MSDEKKQCGRMVMMAGDKLLIQWMGEKDPQTVRINYWKQCPEEATETWKDDGSGTYTHNTCLAHKNDWNVKPKGAKS